MWAHLRRGVDRHAEALSVLGVALLISAVEIVLLSVKYDAFSGGFLQGHPIESALDRALFVSAIVTLHATAFAALAILWFRFSRTVGIARGPMILDWIFWMLLISSLATTVRYQIHNFFGDFLTFAVAKNLGGGSVGDAVRYVTNEASIVGIGLLASMALYFFARKFIASRWHLSDVRPPTPYKLAAAAIAAVATVGVMAAACQSELIWYHMRRSNVHFALDRALNPLTDFDRDDFGLFSFPKDPAPFNAAIFPGALDFPGNGEDEDGLFGDYVHFVRPQPSARALSVDHPNIVIVVLESARGDALDATTASGPHVMPFLRQLAAQGTRSTAYFSHTGYTTSSIKSIFSGSLDESAPPFLLPALKSAGYGIHFISGQDESFGDMAVASGSTELASSFFDARSAPEKRVFPSAAAGSLTLANAEVSSQFDRVAAGADWSSPQFFYVNFQAAHFPYFHPGMPKITKGTPLPRGQIRRENAAALRDTYLNACANNDRSIERLVATLRERGQWERTLLIVVGDHGESLFDDGYLGHGFVVSRTQLNTMFVSNRHLETPVVFGHADLGRLILANAGFTVTPTANATSHVFHYVGALDRPSMIGVTMPDSTMLVFSPASRRATVTHRDSTQIFRGAYPLDGSEHAQILRTAVLEWERLRWEARRNR